MCPYQRYLPTETDAAEVQQLDLFADMAADHFAMLMKGAYIQTFPPLVDLIAEGDPSDFLHVILSGSVELYSGWQDRDSTMEIVRPVSTFILAATIRNAPNLMSARTLEKSRIALIPSQDVRKVFDLDGGFARAIVRELASCYRAVIKSKKDIKLRTSLERLANYLLREQNRTGGEARFELPFDKKRLASLLGMTPENLSRAFQQLQKYGVTVNGPEISITAQAELERFARPSKFIDDPGS